MKDQTLLKRAKKAFAEAYVSTLEMRRIEEMQATKAQKQRIVGRLRAAVRRNRESNEENPSTVVSAIHDLGIYSSRRARLSRELRAMHLAKCMIRGLDYKVVENKCELGNEPRLDDVFFYTSDIFSKDVVRNWLGQ